MTDYSALIEKLNEWDRITVSESPYLETVGDSLFATAASALEAMAKRIEELEASQDLSHTASALGWRAISTAPKDGTLCLFWSPNGGCFIAPSVEVEEPTRAERLAMHKAGADWPNVGWNPTHWMPLPPSPSADPVGEN